MGWAAGISAAAAVLGAGYGAYAGEEQKKAGGKSRRAQSAAQSQAAASAQSAQRDARAANNRANQKQPDIGAILAGAEADRLAGAGSTLLTGVGGIDPGKLKLGGKSTLLGE